MQVIGLEECLRLGAEAYMVAFENVKTAVTERFAVHGLIYDASRDVGVFAGFVGALDVWRRICEDYTQSQADGSLFLLARRPEIGGQLGGWTMLDTATATSGAYWLTQRGLLRRIDMAASDFAYGTANHVMLYAAVTLDAAMIKWTTEDDDRVCYICEQYGHGGERHNGLYLFNDPTLPDPPPAHPNCRCHYTAYFN
jgi:hypothetical protein